MTTLTPAYAETIVAWRQEAEVQLRAEWIGLAGRFTLKPGVNRFGSDPRNDLVLPAGAAPAHVGAFSHCAGQVLMALAPGERDVRVNGVPAASMTLLRSDAAGPPDLVALKALTLFVIQRGARTLIRVRDANSPALARFGGRRWFPVDEAFLVEATFVPYDPPKVLAITNVLGDTSEQTSPGAVVFSLGGQEHRLDVTGWRDGGLALHFRDQTSGELTYGGGRGLITAPPEGGMVTLDFNQAVNLPCAFTAFATCPLPPAQNQLAVRIEAGERRHDLP
ncbi:MAG: DUF1684 domain-containing protein [Chloroflexales bacterium]|nr:DUF1684 domain-containing protein [Chloroflexales bacterium]